jgi:hypothetical protein
MTTRQTNAQHAQSIIMLELSTLLGELGAQAGVSQIEDDGNGMSGACLAIEQDLKRVQTLCDAVRTLNLSRRS